MSSVQRGFEPLVPQQQRPDHHVNGKCQRDDPNIGISLIRLENSLIARFNSLLRRKNSLFRCVGNFSVSHCICSRIWHHLAASQGQTVKIPCFFPAIREFGGFRDEFAHDSLLRRRVCEPSVPRLSAGLGSTAGRSSTSRR